jgi:hypothetical protein
MPGRAHDVGAEYAAIIQCRIYVCIHQAFAAEAYRPFGVNVFLRLHGYECAYYFCGFTEWRSSEVLVVQAMGYDVGLIHASI